METEKSSFRNFQNSYRLSALISGLITIIFFFNWVSLRKEMLNDLEEYIPFFLNENGNFTILNLISLFSQFFKLEEVPSFLIYIIMIITMLIFSAYFLIPILNSIYCCLLFTNPNLKILSFGKKISVISFLLLLSFFLFIFFGTVNAVDIKAVPYILILLISLNRFVVIPNAIKNFSESYISKKEL